MATITGTSGNDTLTGTSSADTLVGSGGNDVYDGAGGVDTLDFRATATALIVDFGAGTISGGFTGSFTNIERVLAGNGNDSLSGGSGADNLSGRAGNDTLEGRAGNDWLWGGGGGEENHFVFHETGTANADQIGDFISGADKIVLDGSVMTALGATGNFAAGDARFSANSSGTAQDASDRVIFETDTRQIWYDPDGTGAAARQLIATLQSGATLTATDILVQGGGSQPGTINGTEGNDTLTGTPGNDTINGFGGNDSLSGLDGDDSLSGGAGNDTLDGGNGNDTLDGGQGDDTYINPDSTVIDAGGVDTIISTAVFVPMPSGIENLVLQGGPFNAGNDIFTSEGFGNELDNRIVNQRAGSTGLDGGAGNDTLIGSATGTNWFEFSSGGTGNYGNDVVDGNGGGAILLAPGSGVTINFQTGVMTGGGTGSVSFTNIHTAQGTSGADLMIGNDSGVTLYGDAGNDTLSGGAGGDWLSGDGFITSDAPEFTTGNDSISGGGGNDTIFGGRGDDVLHGDAGDDNFQFNVETDYGHDTVDGGAGVDSVHLGGFTPQIVDLGAGTLTGGGQQAGADSAILQSIENYFGAGQITGSAVNNVLATGATEDTLNGVGGNDTLTGGGGNDQFVFDRVGAADADHVTDFATGADKIVLDSSAMSALGSSGTFAAGDERFFAAAGASAGHDATDRVVYDTSSGNLWYDADGSGSGAAQLIATLDGAPALSATDIAVDSPDGPIVATGTNGNDTLTGGPGNDTLSGLGGNDSLVGNGGDDSLDGGTGIDTMDGGAGNDTFVVTAGDVLADSSGIDTVMSDGSWTLASGFENLTLLGTGNWEAHGNTSDNVLVGNSGNNILDLQGGSDNAFGGAGNDTFDMSTGGVDAHFGSDFLDGGDGIDTVNFDGFAVSAVDVILEASSSAIFGGSNDGTGSASVQSIENAIGGSFNDTLIGSAAANRLEGRGGNDTLTGHLGNDTLVGGAGTDSFEFHDIGAANADHVTDFSSGTEKVHLDANAMTALGASGNFAAGDARFFAAAGASAGHDADDRVVYDTSTGNLWYDADGNGAQAAQLIATLDGPSSLAATDIVVDNGGAAAGQHIVGTANNDSLAGGSGDDTIEGLGGLDTLNGDGGNDLLAGGSGWDTVTGGAGQDTIAFAEFGSGMNDTVTDFLPGTDTLQLDGAAFTAIGASGRFTANDPRFFAAPGASAGHDADDRLIYDTTSGILYYDADGSGSGGEARVAILDGAPPLAATDITVVNGTPPATTINGTASDDSLVGTPGDDTINGLGGKDTISGELGSDRLDGGAGDDSLFGGESDAEHADGNDLLIGGDGNDTLDATGSFSGRYDGGADTLDGGLGNDVFIVDALDTAVDSGGIDTVVASLGWTLGAGFENLTIAFAEAEDSFVFTGNDLANVIDGNAGYNFVIDGGGGNDSIIGARDGHHETIRGGAGDDTIQGSGDPVFSILDGGDGNDLMTAQAAQSTTMLGGAGDDTLVAGSEPVDSMSGGTGADHFVMTHLTPSFSRITDFETGVDKIHLDATAMTALGANGNFSVDDPRFFASAGGTAGHDADDRVVFDASTGNLYYDPDGSGNGTATFIGAVLLNGAAAPLSAADFVVDNGTTGTPGSTINGTSGSDTLVGATGDDTLNGLGGNDTLFGSGGNDVYDGGAGSDTLDLRGTTTATTVNLAAGTISGGFTGSVTNVERVLSGNGNDSLTGGAGADNLSGRFGSDTLAGGAGSDWLWGGGGGQENHFVFRETGTANADRIGDFIAGADKIDLDNAVMSALGADGAFASGDARFFAGAGAAGGHDANDRVIYDTSTGQLYYDDDGSGAHAAQLVATLEHAPSLAATDIHVI